jgi:hypothetical protein
MDKNIEKVSTLFKTKVFLVVTGIAYFINKDKNTWVSFKVELDDGFYNIHKDNIIPVNGDDHDPSSFMPTFKKSSFVADVKDIPYNIHTLVASNDYYRIPLINLCLDPIHKCIVACNGHLLHTHPLKFNGRIKSCVLINTVTWKLMHHFKITEIYKNKKYIVINKDDVTITSLNSKEKYPSWENLFPHRNTSRTFTQEIKNKILSAIKTFESHGKIMEVSSTKVIAFDGNFIKAHLNDGRSFQIDIGTELFPNMKVGFNVRYLKTFLKVCTTGIMYHPIKKCDGITIINDSIDNNASILMPFHIKDHNYSENLNWITPEEISA